MVKYHCDPIASCNPIAKIYRKCDAHEIIRLLGATGTGKSSFIEALAGSGQNLGISGGTLESVTQDIEAFKVVNMIYGAWPVFLVDSPGFLDNRMSEFAIVKKDEIKKGGRAVKFLNTQSSAIDILSAEYASAFTPQSRFNPHLNRFMGISLIAEAAERIENADAQRKAILDDCFEVFSLYSDPHLETNIDRDVEAVLISSLRDVDMRLVFTYNCLLYYMHTHMKLLDIIQCVSLSASPDVVEHLEATLRVAKINFQHAYQKLCDSIPMPPSLETRFHPFSQSDLITIKFPPSSHPQNGQLPADSSATAGTHRKVSDNALRILFATNPEQIELSGKQLDDFFIQTLREAARSDISALGGIILPNDDEDIQRMLAPPSPPHKT
ncbi:hypothetical protein CVT24_002915 [Panaeolus cyanescens]|uniref:G domain-containing protein n=1 Tax=Panaeolus cyanescens TaxID=181874 RepID=A0A409YRQ0_9AGAR|nr:hypothetical protein CVT24_002915 [Panaeolus cyanescens]